MLLERFLLFWPTFALFATIALATNIYIRLAHKHYKEKIASVIWVKENEKKIRYMFSAPTLFIWAPTFEELLFRAPLLILFDSVSNYAWYGIILSAAAFSWMHWSGNETFMAARVFADEDQATDSDDLLEELEKVKRDEPKTVLIYRIIQTVVTFFLGILLGWITINYQSLWGAAAVHLLWNFFSGLILQLLALIIVSIVYLCSMLWEAIRGD